ncbi:50S ribosomal protein L11 methyltransferase [Deinococcus roseus]|uniref:Ribosomal protein L11 methyltransferase n=1 Tax=Deinococcus roseus TaxID=392414 RepID=A0ABQ2CTE3_9DEIO|nr:50S ribosomal protein L11 methyltransferase [Deinococcus roseus]GGJ19301.1 ribosomal protein L11 methyltransferase [Deinococcus roseus]
MLIYQIQGSLDELDDQLPALWDAGCTGMQELNGSVQAYFEQRVEVPLTGEWIVADDTDWLEKWKADLKPVTVGQITVVPTWLQEEAPKDSIPLIIDPGMAFGTGHHTTTQFAIKALQSLDMPGKKVLDVGAGTGLLALVAGKLGAHASGVDLDPITVPIARENAEINGLNVPFYQGVLSDVLDQGPWDVLVCNLFAELHDALMGEYLEALIPAGDLIMTGILLDRMHLVHTALEREGFTLVSSETEGEWALILAKSPA